MIHVALVSAYPTEAAAREAVTALHPEAVGEYRGIWRAPQPYGGIAHMFSDDDTEKITRSGWQLVSSALPGDADATHLLDPKEQP